MGAGKGKAKRSRAEILREIRAASLASAKQSLEEKGATLDLFTLMGSHAYGLARVDSDLDYRGVYRLSLAEKLGVHGYKDTITLPEGDVVLYELGKFARMLGQGNPNVIEVLFVAPEAESGVGKLL